MDWQPIETAPKDGTVVLVFMDRDVFQAGFGNGRWYFPYASVHETAYHGGGDDYPTHWMPLPEPPK